MTLLRVKKTSASSNPNNPTFLLLDSTYKDPLPPPLPKPKTQQGKLSEASGRRRASDSAEEVGVLESRICGAVEGLEGLEFRVGFTGFIVGFIAGSTRFIGFIGFVGFCR